MPRRSRHWTRKSGGTNGRPIHVHLRACASSGLGRADEVRTNLAEVLSIRLSEVDYLTPSGPGQALRTALESGGICRRRPLGRRLGRPLARHRPGPERALRPHRTSNPQIEGFEFLYVLAHPTARRSVATTPGCLHGEGDWTSLSYPLGCPGVDEAEAGRTALAWQARCYPRGAVAEDVHSREKAIPTTRASSGRAPLAGNPTESIHRMEASQWISTFIDRALGSNIPYITYAVPVFFLLIGVELVVALWERKNYYRLHDSINDLSCGITEQIMGIFLKGLLFAGYQGTYGYAIRTGINLVDVHGYSAGGKWVAAIVLFLGVDCAYYWFHRIAHEYNAPWAGHVVHHSSEDYNLAVALRQGTFQGLFSWVFYLPLALLGFPPAWFAAMTSFNLLYQFWIHTRAIGKLGPAGVGAQHAVAPSRAPRAQSQVSGQELRGHADHLGPDVRHVPGRGGRAGLRPDQAA